MLALMLDPKYKIVKLVNIYLHCEIVATLIVELTNNYYCLYCWRFITCWCPIGFKTLKNLPNLWTFKIYFSNLTQMQTYKDIVRRELGSFCHYPIDLKICKCVFIMVVDKKTKKFHYGYISTIDFGHPKHP